MSGAKPETLKTVIKCVCVEHNWSLSDKTAQHWQNVG